MRSPGVTVRLVRESDAAELAALLRANRDYLTPWEPARDDEFFTEEHQQRDFAQALAQHEQGRTVPYVILDGEDLVGRITVNDIVRGAFQSAQLGYWVGQASTGRGVATAAVAAVVDAAFGELGLHRLQADTLVHNVASQRVLARNGFTRIGLAPKYLRIAGRWQDCLLHQRLSDTLD